MEIVFNFLDSLHISYDKYEHPPVFTTKEAHEHRPDTDFWECKNLFLRNRKGDKHYLVTIHADKRLDLKALGEIVGEKVGFASPERLKKHLDLEPGSVSPFGLLNNTEHDVVFILDKDAMEHTYIGIHPNTNTQTVVMKTDDFKRVIDSLGNPFQMETL
jgi:Ala-tRNA(Pro) deacylase